MTAQQDGSQTPVQTSVSKSLQSQKHRRELMRYGSVCSGVEAATVAWDQLGWKPQFFSEIEKFPSAVLAHHYPNVPNLGDMTQFKEWPNDQPIDLLVGGTPCQSFSVAGLRKGLDDPRGNLMLTYLSMAEQLKPRWLVWENVPGVLSSNKGRDFGTFLSALGKIGYGFSWRILDAQYFGVAQRRRRVFVVGYLGDWKRAAKVLFEPESLSGNPAPSREAGQKVAPTVTQGAPFSRTGNERVECEAIVAQCLTTRTGSAYDPTTETPPVAFSSNMSVPDYQTDGTTPTVKVGGHGGGNPPAVAIQNATRGASQNGLGITTDGPMYTLDVGSQHAVGTPSGFRWHQGSSAGSIGYQSEQSPTLDTSKEPAVATDMQVRRLTNIECERLQGFPDNYTQIPWRNKTPENCPDGPRYKAMGNSMAVPVMRWIGERIQKIEESYNGKWTQS
jgi:DNA (cytosine-5)-methyltransferase 1